jgi:RNA polymerase sigma factor (sigma-70 family)
MATTAVWRVPVRQEDDGELVRLVRAGDSEAAGTLLARHDALLHRVCRHLLPSGEDVDAVVQEALLRALRGIGRFTGSGSFAGWLATIAVNLCRDRLRRRRLIPFLPLETTDDDEPDPIAVLATPEPGPERVVMARQALELVRREVSILPRRQREVFVLRFFCGMALESIAGTLGLEEGTVKTHLHRAVHRVRSAVEEATP